MRYLVLVLVLVLASPAAFAMRCGNRLVSSGDQDFQVRDRCGAPFWSDRYVQVDVIGAYGPVERQTTTAFDVWYYNFGPSQLMRRLVFREGRLIAEDTLGYGVSEIGGDCDPKRILDGLSSGELIARCGEPSSRRGQYDTIVRRSAPGLERWGDERREEWIYDFGDRRRVRIVHLVDGRVAGVELVPR